MLELGKAIRIVREAKGMKMSALAKSGGVSIPFLSLVESGARNPSLSVLRRIAIGLGIPPEVLIILAQPPDGLLQSGDSKSQALVQAIQKLLSVENELRSRLELEESADEPIGDDYT